MSKKEVLKEYKAKRDLESSGEPSGKNSINKNKPIFVVQKHNASQGLPTEVSNHIAYFLYD